ncbi:MAG: oligopeptide transporter, OPT family, partial [Proteobacteria bacterium]|nr:oligopeptide transporter, OPT family [Pseudomonadota bacterium]
MQNNQIQEPLIPASIKLPEMTVRVIIFSIILAAILAASDAYLALKIGTTIAASIPAAVLSMGILRLFKNSNVLESNMIQTAASAGEGVAAAMAFTLPALVMTHAWNSFPYWETVLITITGGILGVLFSVPLRRILFNIPTLRFPEGTAVGNVLKVSTTGGKHLKYLVQGVSTGGIVSLIQSGFKIIGDELDAWGYIGKTVFGMSVSFEPALIAAGYIVGIQVGISFLVGIIVGWCVILPAIGLIQGVPHTSSAFDAVMTIWSHQSRYVGVGVLLVGGVWTLITLLRPVIHGFRESIAASRSTHVISGAKLLRTERDIPFYWIVIVSLVVAVVIFGLIYEAMAHAGLVGYGNIHLLSVSL